jgi:hypothetical protein
MVKLLKYELKCLYRTAVIPMIVMILLAILARISLIAIQTEAAGAIMLTILFYLFAMMATLLVCFFYGLSRFYKSLFTSEGYLTMSLPLTVDEIVCAKLLSSIIVAISGIVVCILSTLVFTLGNGNVWETIVNTAIDWTGQAFSGTPLEIVEAIVQLIVELPETFLVFYFVMALAQLFTTKNRTVMFVLIFIGLSFVVSLFNTLVGDRIAQYIAYFNVHLWTWLEILLNLAIDVFCYLMVRYILTHKLNLVN